MTHNSASRGLQNLIRLSQQSNQIIEVSVLTVNETLSDLAGVRPLSLYHMQSRRTPSNLDLFGQLSSMAGHEDSQTVLRNPLQHTDHDGSAPV